MNIHEKFLPLWTDNEYDTVIISGGRGGSKSFTAQVFVNDLTYEAGHKIIVSRFTMVSAKESIIPEFEEKLGLLKSPHGKHLRIDDFEMQQSKAINLHSKSEVYFHGLKSGSKAQTAKLKSIQGITTLVIEEGEEIPDDGDDTKPSTYDKIEDSIRTKGVRLRKIIMWNPSDVHSFVYKRFFAGLGENKRDIPIDFNGRIGKTLYIHTTYEDNKENLAEPFLEKAEKTKKTNPARFNHIYVGHPLKDVEGALWKQSTMIDPFRVQTAPEFKRVVTAIDPSVSDDIFTNGKKNDECGIIVAGMDYQNPPHFYIWKDESGDYTTGEWGKKSVGIYKNTSSDRLLAEKNQGGDLVKKNLHIVDRHIPVTLIHAKKGKIARAEPVAALAEEGRLHHIGRFPELEQEMTTYDGTGPSPNRYDACLTKHHKIRILGQGYKKISDVTTKHFALTRKGFKRVIASQKTGINKQVYFVMYSNGCYTIGTANHPIYINGVWKNIIDLKKGDKICSEKSDNLMGKNTQDIQIVTKKHQEIIMLILNHLKSLCYILLYGNFITSKKSLKICIYIISMVTRLIIYLIICVVARIKSTGNCIEKAYQKKEKNLCKNTVMKSDHLQKNGTVASRGLNGIDSTEKNAGKIKNQKKNQRALFVAKVINHISNQISVLKSATQNIVLLNIKKLYSVQSAEKISSKTNTEMYRQPADVLVVDVMPLRKKMDVYNLEVEDEHEYFANGVLVHNCVYALLELSQNAFTDLRIRSLY